ncbi:MAG: hypothetical protein AAGA53_09290, partial [Pseudomonadota bacterium]
MQYVKQITGISFKLLILLMAFSISAIAEEQTPEPVLSLAQQAMKAELENQASKAKTKLNKKRLSEIYLFYEENEFLPVWTTSDGISQKANSVIDILSRAEEHALDPADYAIAALQNTPKAGDDAIRAAYEVRFSMSLVAFAQHLNAGRVNPKTVTRENVIYPEAISALKILQQTKSTGNVVAYLRLLAPHTPRYERLRLAMAAYKNLAASGGWETLEAG